jgi:hypothetical protein
LSISLREARSLAAKKAYNEKMPSGAPIAETVPRHLDTPDALSLKRRIAFERYDPGTMPASKTTARTICEVLAKTDRIPNRSMPP